MISTALLLLSFTYLTSATDEEGSAFGDDAPYVAPKRKLTLRKPKLSDDESESAFGDVDFLNDVAEIKPKASSSKPELRKKPEIYEESAFGDVDYLRDVAEDAHSAASSKPALRRKREPEYEESAFGDGPETGDSFEKKEIQQLDEKQSLVEESALGGELKDDAEADLDDKDMKAQYDEGAVDGHGLHSGDSGSAPERDSEQRVDSVPQEVRPADAKPCVGAQCEAERWSPVRNVHAYGPSGKPANWKPRNILGKDGHEPPRERGPRIYSRHQAVEHQAPPKRSLEDFMSSFLER